MKLTPLKNNFNHPLKTILTSSSHQLTIFFFEVSLSQLVPFQTGTIYVTFILDFLKQIYQDVYFFQCYSLLRHYELIYYPMSNSFFSLAIFIINRKNKDFFFLNIDNTDSFFGFHEVIKYDRSWWTITWKLDCITPKNIFKDI